VVSPSSNGFDARDGGCRSLLAKALVEFDKLGIVDRAPLWVIEESMGEPEISEENPFRSPSHAFVTKRV
jgi:hypothetical protein